VVEYSFCKMVSQCQRGLANPRRFVAGVRAGNGYLLYTRLLMLACGPDTFF
jgi:hypothetical protein